MMSMPGEEQRSASTRAPSCESRTGANPSSNENSLLTSLTTPGGVSKPS
jgi:hypothetical protein